jgi:hypothetical protein
MLIKRTAVGLAAFAFMVAATQGCNAEQPQDPSDSEVQQGVNAGGRAVIDANAKNFANAVFRMTDHHDRTYYRLKGLYSSNLLTKKKRTLIHVDYHADLYRADSHLAPHDGEINIGNYINAMIHQKDVKEVYWIIPEDTRSIPGEANVDLVNSAISHDDGCQSIGSKRSLFWGPATNLTDIQFRDGPAEQKICVHSSGHFSYVSGTQACPAATETIPFHKRTLGDILKGAGNSQRIEGPTILDIDCDFFDNSGWFANTIQKLQQSPVCYQTRYSPERLEKELTDFMTAVTVKMQLMPDYISVARSPGYTSTKPNDDNAARIFSLMEYLGTKTRNHQVHTANEPDEWTDGRNRN